MLRKNFTKCLVVIAAILQPLQALSADDEPVWWKQYNGAGIAALNQLNYALAEQQFSRALKELEQHSPNDPEIATVLNNLASVYYAEGKYAESKSIYKRAIDIDEKTYGSESGQVALPLQNLADVYADLSDFASAEHLYERALAIFKIRTSKDSPQVAGATNHLARLYYKEGQYAKAEPLLVEALAAREKSFGPNHPLVGESLNNLAEAYRVQGKYDAAEPLYKRALPIDEASFGTTSPKLSSVLNNLGLLYSVQHFDKKAEPLFRRAISIEENSPAANSLALATSLDELGQLCMREGRYAEAKTLYQRALNIRQTRLGQNNPDVAISLNNMGALAYSEVRYDDAERLFKQSLNIWSKINPNHPEAKKTQRNLTVLERVRDNGATDQPNKSDTQAPPVLPPNTQSTTTKPPTEQQPGMVAYLYMGKPITKAQFMALQLGVSGTKDFDAAKYEQSEAKYRQALNLWPECSVVRASLAFLLGAEGRLVDAQSVAAKARALAPDKQDTLLASGYVDGYCGDFQKAISIFEKLHTMYPDFAKAANSDAIVASLKKEAESASDVTDPSANDFFQYAATCKWAPNRFPLKVYIPDDATASKVANYEPAYGRALRSAFEEWQTRTGNGISFQFVDAGQPNDIDCRWVDNKVDLKSPAEGGECNLKFTLDAGAQHADIKICTADLHAQTNAPSSLATVGNVCLHEIGHALGLLAHSPDPHDRMFWVVFASPEILPLTSRDLATVKHLYSAQVPLVPNVNKHSEIGKVVEELRKNML